MPSACVCLLCFFVSVSVCCVRLSLCVVFVCVCLRSRPPSSPRLQENAGYRQLKAGEMSALNLAAIGAALARCWCVVRNNTNSNDNESDCVYVCIDVYICTYIYIYIYIHMYRCIYICIYIYMFTHVYIYIYIHTYTHIHIHTYTQIHVCMYRVLSYSHHISYESVPAASDRPCCHCRSGKILPPLIRKGEPSRSTVVVVIHVSVRVSLYTFNSLRFRN